MNSKQESILLREMIRIYEDCPGRVAAHARCASVSGIAAFVFFAIASVLIFSHELGAVLPLLFAVLAGIAIGRASAYKISVKQMPLLVRFTHLRETEIHRQILELEKEDS